MNENPRGQLDLLLLAVLRGAPAHGYAIVSALSERSGGVCDFPEGTVYPALQKLEREGLVRSEWEHDGARKRRVYRLTRAGASALVKKTEGWKRLANGVQAVLAWQE
jgi:DNA-binding PadR family transcriptional regulator